MNGNSSDILTPDQAAAYLQVNRETIYRYIRDGKLVAARLGRSYRIPRRSLELLLLANLVRSEIPMREYSDAETERFLASDQLDVDATRIVERLTKDALDRDAG
jgi:excisionase family DNA binding protein